MMHNLYILYDDSLKLIETLQLIEKMMKRKLGTYGK